MRRDRTASSRNLAFLLFALITAQVFGQNLSTWEEALHWLRANRESPQFGNVVLMATTLAPDVESVEDLADRYLSEIPEHRIRGEVAYRVGRVLDTANRFSRASHWYSQALREKPDHVDALLNHSALLLELGQTENAIAGLTRVIRLAPDRVSQRTAAILRARAHFIEGNIGLARLHAQSLLGTNSEVEVLFLLAEIATATDDSALMERIAARLEREFPAAPERVLVTSPIQLDSRPDPAITFSPTPTRIFGNLPRPELPPRSAEAEEQLSGSTERARADPEVTARETPLAGIQTGSFRDRENARYMVRDIENSGFAATISAAETASGTFYRVIIPVNPGSTVADAQDIVVRLKEIGIEGFLVFDRRE